jgi:hypothetical protein
LTILCACGAAYKTLIVGESNSWAIMDVVGEGFTGTCSNEEALKLVVDYVVMVGQVIDM